MKFTYLMIDNTTAVDSFSTCVEKMNAQYVGKFLSENTIEATMLDLYLKDFVAITLQPTSDLEAQVRLVFCNCSTWLQNVSWAPLYFSTYLPTCHAFHMSIIYDTWSWSLSDNW